MNKRVTKVAKAAIRLSPNVLRIVDEKCKARGESRSQFFRHAVEALLRQTNEQKAVQRYIQGYPEQPDTQAEIGTATQTSQTVLSQEPWESSGGKYGRRIYLLQQGRGLLSYSPGMRLIRYALCS